MAYLNEVGPIENKSYIWCLFFLISHPKHVLNHEGTIHFHAFFYFLGKFIHHADHELRLAIGLPELQGPARDKEKREKERSELRDLVNSAVWLGLYFWKAAVCTLMQDFFVHCLLVRLERTFMFSVRLRVLTLICIEKLFFQECWSRYFAFFF